MLPSTVNCNSRRIETMDDKWMDKTKDTLTNKIYTSLYMIMLL